MQWERLAKFGVTHTATVPSGWWEMAVQRLKLHRARGNARYDAYRNFLRPFLGAEDTNATGYVLEGLTDSQRWLLLVMIDEFLDQEIVHQGNDAEWLRVWPLVCPLYENGYLMIARHPEVLDRETLGKTWAALEAEVRAATPKRKVQAN